MRYIFNIFCYRFNVCHFGVFISSEKPYLEHSNQNANSAIRNYQADNQINLRFQSKLSVRQEYTWSFIEKTKTGCKYLAKPINICDVMIIRFILNVINHNDICFVHRCPKRSAPGPHDSPLSEMLAFCLEIGIRHPSFVWLWL